MIGNKYAGWWLTDESLANDRDIGWAESIALELAIYWLIQEGYQNTDVTVYSDNTGIIGAFSNSHSQNQPRNTCIHHITSSLIPVNLTISPKYIPSSENLADPISWGSTFGYSAHLPCDFEIPTAIANWLIVI